MPQQNWQPRTRTWHDRKTSPVLLAGHFCRVWIINQYSVKFKFHVRAAANAMVWKPQIQEFSRILPLAGDPAQKLYGPPIGALVIISCITRPSDKVIEKYQIFDIFGENEFPNGLSGGNMAKDPKDKTVLRVQCKPKLKVNCKNKKYNIQFAQKRSASMTVQMI